MSFKNLPVYFSLQEIKISQIRALQSTISRRNSLNHCGLCKTDGRPLTFVVVLCFDRSLCAFLGYLRLVRLVRISFMFSSVMHRLHACVKIILSFFSVTTSALASFEYD